MARPRKLGLDYFPFDVDFFNDEKIIPIAGEFGPKGELTIIKLLCAVYRNGYFIQWNDLIKYKLASELRGVTPDLLDQIINRLVKWGFFDKHLFDSASILTSHGIQRRYFNATRKRVDPPTMPYLLGFRAGNSTSTPISGAETPVSSAETPQSKVKNNKKSTDVDQKASSSSSSPPSSTENFISQMKRSPIWIDASAKNLAIPPDTLLNLLDQFANYCISTGADAHTDLRDAKSHFISWAKKQSTSQTNEHNPQRNKPGNPPSKTPPIPGCRLNRRPDPLT